MKTDLNTVLNDALTTMSTVNNDKFDVNVMINDDYYESLKNLEMALEEYNEVESTLESIEETFMSDMSDKQKAIVMASDFKGTIEQQKIEELLANGGMEGVIKSISDTLEIALDKLAKTFRVFLRSSFSKVKKTRKQLKTTADIVSALPSGATTEEFIKVSPAVGRYFVMAEHETTMTFVMNAKGIRSTFENSASSFTLNKDEKGLHAFLADTYLDQFDKAFNGKWTAEPLKEAHRYNEHFYKKYDFKGYGNSPYGEYLVSEQFFPGNRCLQIFWNGNSNDITADRMLQIDPSFVIGFGFVDHGVVAHLKEKGHQEVKAIDEKTCKDLYGFSETILDGVEWLEKVGLEKRVDELIKKYRKLRDEQNERIDSSLTMQQKAALKRQTKGNKAVISNVINMDKELIKSLIGQVNAGIALINTSTPLLKG